MSASRLAVLAVFAFTAVYFTELFPPANNSNELSRFEAVVAFVDHGTFAIDIPLAKYGDHEDKSVYDGRTYSNKAPGLIFAGVAVYRLLRFFAPPPADAWAPLFYLMRLLTVSLVSFLAVTRFSKRLSREPFGDGAAAVAMAVTLGTPFLFYARSFFSHAWTASLLFLTWDACVSAEEKARGAGWRMFLAGFLASLAAVSEYTAAPVALLLAARVLWGWRLRAFAAFCLGAIPFLVLLLFYNAACFGSPWSLSSAHEGAQQYADLARRGLFGVGPPNPRVMLAVFFDQSRGLVLFSPMWLWAAAGFVAWWRSKQMRRDCVFAAAAVVSSVVILSGYEQWEGGFCLGPRYLVPLTFFAALAIPFALRPRASRRLFAVAAAFSVAQLFLLTSSWPYIARDQIWPVANIAWWTITHHWVAPNLGHDLGLPPVWSLLPPAAATIAALWLSLRRLSSGDPVWRTAASIGAGLAALTLVIELAPPLPGGGAWRDWLIHFLKG